MMMRKPTTVLHGGVDPVAYPELDSGGVSKSRKFKLLVNGGASKGVAPWFKKIMARGGVPDNQKTPWIRHCT